jgi:hypothetical protein
MNPETQVRFDPFEVSDRLRLLGLVREPFERAAAENLSAYRSCTPNHPPTFPGLAGWAEMNRSLRDDLTALDWECENETNLPLVVNRQGTMAITATSGDANTGIKEGFPCTRSPKGPRIAAAIKANQLKFAFEADVQAVVQSMKARG